MCRSFIILMCQNHRLSYDDDDLLRRKSPLASKRRETVQRGNDSARRPERSVSAAPVESDRRDVGAKRTDSQLRVDNAVAYFHDCQLQF